MVKRHCRLAKTMLKTFAQFFLRTFVLSALIFIIAANASAVFTGYSNQIATAREKNFNYDFSVRDTSGRKISFTEFRGKVLFINLWATWCGPCRSEMPTIEQLYQDAGSDEIKFVMLSLDTEKTLKNIEGYIKANAYTFPVYTPSGYLPEQFQVSYIPATFIVSKQGKILMTVTGGTDFNVPKYKKLLEEEAAR